MQTEKIVKIPIILVGYDYWQGLLGWIESTMMTENCIDQHDRDLITVVDDVDDVLKIILSHRALTINN